MTACRSWCRGISGLWFRHRPSGFDACGGICSGCCARRSRCGSWSDPLRRSGRNPTVSPPASRAWPARCAKDGAARTARTTAFWMNRRSPGCATRVGDTDRARGAAVLCRARAKGGIPGFVHLSWETRLHAGPVVAVRRVQQLLLRRAARLHGERRCRDAGNRHRRRGRHDAHVAGIAARNVITRHAKAMENRR